MNNALHKALNLQMPFVLYRKPHQQTVNGWFPESDRLIVEEKLTTSSFVFAPFIGSKKVVFYQKDSKIIQENFVSNANFSNKDVPFITDESIQKKHVQLVEKGIEAIRSGMMQKVVLSRKEVVNIDKQEYAIYFQRFLHRYPTAFVYWWYHPNIGMWMGATPEQLIFTEDLQLQTVALAGTMVDTNIDLNQVVWGIKEQEEQKVVRDYIVDRLQDFCDTIETTQPYTYRAGSLLHIKTDIYATLHTAHHLQNVIESLHPTPALCGFPKEVARDFIITHEGYDREYYGGFLGEWQCKKNDQTSTDLFVN